MNKDLTQLKILYLIKTMDVGGAEKFTFNLCSYFSDKVKKITVYSSGGIFVDELLKINISHIISEYANSKNFLRIRGDIQNILSAENFDIIHVQHRFFLPILKTLNINSAKIIYTANNFFDDIYQKMIFPDIAVAISPSIENNLIKTTLIDRAKIININYGVELKNSFDHPHERIMLGFIGRLIKEKGIYQLIEAVKELNSDSIKLIICGDGPEKNNILKLIDAYGLDNKIKYLSPTINIDDIYRLIDVLILPTSLNEGLPISILEALAREIIIITTTKGAITDVIIDKETGLLLEENSAKNIINKINYLIDNPEEIQKIRKKGYDKVKSDYSIESMLQEYERLYMKC